MILEFGDGSLIAQGGVISWVIYIGMVIEIRRVGVIGM